MRDNPPPLVMDPRLADLKPLIDEMAARGYLDAFLVRHHTPEVESHVEGAVSRLVSSVARKLGDEGRAVIRSEAESIDSIVAATLVETAHELVSSDPVEALLDQINGRFRILPRAVTNDVLDLGRKAGAKKRKPVETVSFDDGFEVEAEEEPEVLHTESAEPIPPEWLAAIREMQREGQRMTFSNLAKTLGYSRQYLHRLRSRRRSA